MSNYSVEWKDYSLPTGREFSVAVCGYTGRICHMFLGDDVLRRTFVSQIKIEDGVCSGAAHCLALECPLNKTSKEHLAHMLDMNEDEILDDETAKMWGTESTVDGLVKFAEKLADEMAEEAKEKNEVAENPSGGNCA